MSTRILWDIVIALLAVWIIFTCYILFRIGQILNNIKELISGISEVSDSLFEDIKQLVNNLAKSIDSFNSGISGIRDAGVKAANFFRVASSRLNNPAARILSFLLSFKYLMKKRRR
jgi:predicted PurR-regulated permease PerM